MNAADLKKLFQQVRSGKLSPDEAVEQLRHLPFEDLGFAKVDHHRAIRAGMPEVIFGPGKAPAHLAEIFSKLAARGNNVLATRVTPEQVRAVRKKLKKAEHSSNPTLARRARLAETLKGFRKRGSGKSR